MKEYNFATGKRVCGSGSVSVILWGKYRQHLANKRSMVALIYEWNSRTRDCDITKLADEPDIQSRASSPHTFLTRKTRRIFYLISKPTKGLGFHMLVRK